MKHDHHIWFHVLHQASGVSDKDEGGFFGKMFLEKGSNSFERVDIYPSINLIKEGKAGSEEGCLERLEFLSLTTRETDIE